MALFSLFSRGSGLRALSALDDRRLRDLGLDRFDLVAARSQGKSRGSFLTERRTECAVQSLR